MIGTDFDTPVMYQDLANYTMTPMGTPIGSFGAATSYLGGVQMPRQLDSDKVEIMNKKKSEAKDTFKKTMLGIGACLLLGYIPYFRKKINKAGGIVDYIKGLFKKPTPPAVKPSRWKRFKAWTGAKWTSFKNIFKKKPTSTATKPSCWKRFKAWTGAKWTSFKNIFKKKPKP